MKKWFLAYTLLGSMMNSSFGDDQEGAKPEARRGVTSDDVAVLPAPGTAVPGAISFISGDKSLEYLLSESNTLDRVLWRLDLAGGEPARVVARPPGKAGGDDDTNVSQEEALRRERQRLRETGITHAIRAADADVTVFPLGGDLYLQRDGKGALEQITHTKAPEIDPKLSHDGTKVAYVRENELYVLDLGSKKETKLSEGAAEGLSHGLAEFMAQEEMDRSTGFWWAPDGLAIAYQETDERHIPLYTIAHQGGPEFSTETHRYPFPGAANARVRLGVVSAAGGMTKWLTIADKDEDVYLARVEWESPKALLVQILSRDQKSLRLYRVDVESDHRSLLIEEKSDTWVNLHADLRLLEATGEFLWSSERSGFRRLELRDRDGGLVRVLTTGEWPVDGVAGFDAGRREAWFTAGRESPLESQLYRVSLDGGEVLKITREPGTHKVVVAKDGGYYVDTFSSRSVPPRTTLRDRAGALVALIHDASKDERLSTLRLRAPELTEFKSRDGVTLYGAYYAPRAMGSGGRAPLIVMVYGGPHIQLVSDSWEMTADLMAQFLTERGFAVWKMDNRGSMRRGHVFESAINRDMGSLEVRDQADGVKFVSASWPEVDTTKVGVMGGSYGGYMTLRCMTEAPEVFRSGVASAPVTDWDGYDTCYTERYMGTPADNPKGYQQSSVISHANQLVGDLLVIHGLLDENVHFRHTARLTNALIRASKPFQLLPLPNERHGSRRAEDRRYVAERTIAFFEKSLAPSTHP